VIPFTPLGPWFAGVSVTVNGHDYKLFVDTGGGTTRFAPELIAEAGLTAAGDGRARDAFGEHDTLKAVVESFVIDGHEIRDLDVILFDEDQLYAASDERVVGFLGHDVLDRFCATFDLTAGTLDLDAAGSLRDQPHLECRCDTHGWFVHAQCGDETIRLQLDLGAGISCLRSQSALADRLEFIEGLIARTAATSGTQDCRVGTLPGLRVGDVALPTAEFALGEFDLDDADGNFVDGLLGIDALGTVRFTVDAAAQAARFLDSVGAL
jgi:hypothetical protein